MAIRDRQSLQVVRTFSSREGAGPLLAFSRSGHLMATGSPLGKIRVFNVASGRVVASLGPISKTYTEKDINDNTQAISQVDVIAMSPDGSLVAAAENIGEVFGNKYYTWSSTSVHIWDVRAGRKIAVLRGHNAGRRPAQIVSATFSPDGDMLATGGQDGTARLWHAQTGRLIATLSHHGRTPYGLAFTPDGKYLVTATYEHVRVWDLQSMQSSVRVSAQSGYEGFESFALDHSGRVVAVGQADNRIRLWSLERGKILRTLGTKQQWRFVIAVAFSPDGALLATVAWEGGEKAVLELWGLSPQ
ncbi:MAG: WD40 repeat domain-containing protein [bacterium]